MSLQGLTRSHSHGIANEFTPSVTLKAERERRPRDRPPSAEKAYDPAFLPPCNPLSLLPLIEGPPPPPDQPPLDLIRDARCAISGGAEA